MAFAPRMQSRLQAFRSVSPGIFQGVVNSAGFARLGREQTNY